jgi:hypothetical protein
MRAKAWLDSFFNRLNEIEDAELDHVVSAGEWTQLIGRLMDKIGEDLHWGVAGRKPDREKEESEEYLGIDFMFLDRKDYDENRSVLPRAIVEHENSWNREKIEYCLWKILCVRSPLRVLICYQRDSDSVEGLRKHLEDVIWHGDLMKGDRGDLLVIVASESLENNKDLEWNEYFKVFEWRGDTLS